MIIQKIAAFSDGNDGGNPAGVVLTEAMPSAEEMQRVAAEVGFSETIFAELLDTGKWRTRYFSPETEVPFCGHATIALGAALAKAHGAGTYQLVLNDAEISVSGEASGDIFAAALQSPPTKSERLSGDEVANACSLFGLSAADLDARIEPARIHGGADHFVLVLKDRGQLAAMNYDLDEGREFMRANRIVTIMLVHIQSARQFNVRNPFASGGVLEDPATGAAAAAFGGYLRDIEWPHNGSIDIMQGEDMGVPSRIKAVIAPERGTSIQVSGTARQMT